MSARVSEIHFGVITTGGHKILPYDVVVIENGSQGRRRSLLSTLY